MRKEPVMQHFSLRVPGLIALAWGWLLCSGWAQEATRARPSGPDAETDRASGPPRSGQTDETDADAPTAPAAQTAARDAEIVRFHEAVALMHEDDYANSIPLLESIVQTTPGLVNAWEALCSCYVKVGRLDDAERLMKQLLAIDPSLPRTHRTLGQLAIMQDNLPKAEEYYRTSLQKDPGQYEARLELAGVLRRQNRTEAAIALLRQLREEDPDRNDVMLELARRLREDQQYEQALPYWKQLVALDPQNEEYLTSVARIQLDAGQAQDALETATRILAENEDNPIALGIMADLMEYGDQPAEALPYLKRIIENADTPMLAQAPRLRFIMLSVRLHSFSPLKYALDDAIAQAEDFYETDPGNVEGTLLLAEMYGIDRQDQAAEKLFQSVLRNDNPRNRRAHNGLFEVYLAQAKFKEARQSLKQVESFNPLNPYLYYTRAKFAAAQGDYGQAFRELDLLEAAGQRGAVAGLLYHGLTRSEWTETTSVSRFREQLLAFQEAGFRFLTPDQLPEYFASHTNGPARTNGAASPPAGSPERVIMITFDDARRDSVRLGTDIARDFNMAFAMHVPIGNVEEKDPFLCSWEEIKQYEATGAWKFGSHMVGASDPHRIESINAVVHPSCNRLWLPAQNRLETEGEFLARIQDEYRLSRDILEKQLGCPVRFVAYPMGDIGQETRSDMPDAIEINLREAATYYEVGFIQSQFNYAIQGDNPLLYKRYEFSKGVSGAEAVESILLNHPVLLAHRMRAEYAAQEGKIYKSKEALAQLKQDGYPSNAYKKVASYVRKSLASARTAPQGVEKVDKGPFHVEFKYPYVGVRAEYFEDNNDSRNWRIQGLGGVHLTPNLAAEVRAGIGRMEQPYSFSNTANINGPIVKLDERSVSVAPSFKFPNGWMLQGEIGTRQLSGDIPANTNNGRAVSFDEPFLQYVLEAQIKPFLPMDVNARWEGDVVPAASAAAKSKTYQAGALSVYFSLFDWWGIYGDGSRYMFSDDNTRSHLGAGTRWLIYDPLGLHLGLRYDYSTSDEDDPDYWTPYDLNRFYIEALFRKTYRQVYYNLGIRYGMGKQEVRPDASRQYQDDLAQLQRDLQTAIRNKWSPTSIANIRSYINEMAANPPDDTTSWEPILELVASTRIQLGRGRHWELNGEVSYNILPDYEALRLLGGIKYKF